MESDQDVPDADTKNHKALQSTMKGLPTGTEVVVLVGARIQYSFLY